MILDQLAANTATPPSLLTHLVAHLVATYDPRSPRTGWELREALLSNPHVTTAQVHALANVGDAKRRSHYLARALQRPGTTGADAIAVLSADPSAANITAALKVIHDPALDRWALEHVASTTVWFELISSDLTPPDVRWQAARLLAAGARPLRPKAVTRVLDLVRTTLAYARTPAEHQAGVGELDALIEASAHVDLTRRLQSVGRTWGAAPAGSLMWLRDPAREAEEAIAWAGADVTRWLRALRQFHDPSGDLARAAIAHQPELAVAVLAGRAVNVPSAHRDVVPLEVLTGALLLAVATGQQVPLYSRTSAVITGADFTAVAAYLQGPVPPAWLFIVAAASRADLGPGDIDVILGARSRHARSGGRGWSAADWGAWVVTQPRATPEQRRLGLELISTADVRGRTPAAADRQAAALEQLARFARVAQDLDPGDEVSVARVGGALPVALFTSGVPGPGANLRGLASPTWLLSAAIRAHLGGAGPEVGAALCVLGPNSSGTVGELLGTAVAIAA